MVFQRRQVLVAVGEDVGDEPHRRAGRVDVGPPGDVLLQDVVLDRPADLGVGDPLLLGHQLVEQQQDAGGGVDGHRRRHLVEREARQQEPHVVDRVDGHPDLAHLAHRRGGGRSRSPSGWAGRRRTTDRCRRWRAGAASARWWTRRCRSRSTGASSTGGRGTWSRYTPRVNGYDPGSPSCGVGIPAGQVGRGVDGADLDPRVGLPTLARHGPQRRSTRRRTDCRRLPTLGR